MGVSSMVWSRLQTVILDKDDFLLQLPASCQQRPWAVEVAVLKETPFRRKQTRT